MQQNQPFRSRVFWHEDRKAAVITFGKWRDLEGVRRQLAALGTKLGNQQFVARAPAEVVARERDKEVVWRAQREVLTAKLRALGCG